MSKTETYKCPSYYADDGTLQNCACGECSYEESVRRWKKAYEDVLETCEKHSDLKDKYTYSFSDIHDMGVRAKDHLLLIEWYEKYGLKLDHGYRPYSFDYLDLKEYVIFNRFGDGQKDKNLGSGKYISWSDDGRQPKDEWLLEVSFPTGAYIFGKDYSYQQQLFQDFFDELKSYKPDYSDSHNSCLYWKLENAKLIFNSFSAILKKYKERNQSELKQRRAEKLRKELESLEAES